MKVCFFNRSYWPDHGATGQLLTELCEALVARHGLEVTVAGALDPATGMSVDLGVVDAAVPVASFAAGSTPGSQAMGAEVQRPAPVAALR